MTPPIIKKSGFPRQLNDYMWVINLYQSINTALATP